MKLLVVGGTQFIGRAIVRTALSRGFEVAVFHRGEHEPSNMNDVLHMHGDTLEIEEKADEISSFNPDVAIDTTQFRTATTNSVISALTGIVRRYVLTSSIDVYLAYGRLHGTEPGPLQKMPVAESAELRTLPGFGLTAEIDNLLAERAALGQEELPVTIARLPAVFGIGDYQRRIGEHLDKMKKSESTVPMPVDLAQFRWSWGYVQNIADALLDCAVDVRGGHHVYNLGYPEGISNLEMFEMIAEAAGWRGKLVTTPYDPEIKPKDRRQHWIADTSRIRKELGYAERVPVREAVRLTVEAELTGE